MSALTDKLNARGANSLSDTELLSLLLDDDELAERLIESYSGVLTSIAGEDLSRLRMFEGLGLKRAVRLVAAAEWGRRISVAKSSKQETISTSGDVVAIFRPMMESLRHEECWVLYLNSANKIVEQQRVSQGGITTTTVDHRLIVKRALELLATRIVLVHNHPSGSSQPSEEDDRLTSRLRNAAELFDIILLDHIIISPTGEFSYKSALR